MAFGEYIDLYSKLEKRIGDGRPIDALLRAELSKKAELENQEKLEKVAKDLRAEGFKTTIKLDEEHGIHFLAFHSETQPERILDWELLSSPEYRRLFDLHKRVHEYDRPPFIITSNGNKLTIDDRKELVEHVMSVGRPVNRQFDSTSPEQALATLMRSVIAHNYHIPTKGIGRTPGMKCSTGLLVDWEALAAMEITPELVKGYLTLLASGDVVGRELGCDGGQLNTDEPGYQIWMKKIKDLPADQAKEIFGEVFPESESCNLEEATKQHTFEFWLGIRIENEAIQTTIYDSEERQARILDTYKKTMAALASVCEAQKTQRLSTSHSGLAQSCPSSQLLISTPE